MKAYSISRNALLATTALAVGAWLPAAAYAQEAEGNVGLEEIVVTAQKREQSMQDVPIAITAVTQENLQANRIFTVNDLSAVAPGVTVKPSAGGISTPSFTMRGQVSYGVVAGSDKQVSIYVDGVYIGSPRGSIFQLPDIARLEVLRGPQGTLFGRNATAGAVSVTTRDPSGDAHVKLEGSYGNYDAYRLRATVETPEFGPFSAYFSYVRDYRRGEIHNAAAGTQWDRTAAGFGRARAAEWLGTVDSNSYFAAVKFEPSDSFKMVYKYDRNDDSGTPEGTGFLAWDRAASGGLLGNVLTALYTSQNTYIKPDAKRPDEVTNAWVIPRDQQVQGHSLTSTWQASDNITVKDIFGYRKAHVFAPSAIDGVGTLTFTPQTLLPFATLTAVSQISASVPGFATLPPAQQQAILAAALPTALPATIAGLSQAGIVGQRVAIVDSQAYSSGDQWSNELQINYSSERLQATVGALWFQSDDLAGGPTGMQNTLTFGTFIPSSGTLFLGDQGKYTNHATSLAAYTQLEFKITPQLEVVGGARVTYDKKSSTFLYDVRNPQTGVVSPRPLIVPPDYKKTKPNWLIGLNWTPNDTTLVYAKYSTSFVSGGSTAGVPYDPETASSFEVGLKADFFEHRLRTNLALFHVDYNHFQSPQSTSSPSSVATVLPYLIALYGPTTANELANLTNSRLSTFVIDQGKVRAQGFELEVSAVPVRGVNVGGSLSYTNVKFPYINPVVLAGNGGTLLVTTRPEWTGSFYGSYETEPLFADTTLQLRADVLYRSTSQITSNPAKDIYADGSNAAIAEIKGYAQVNGRIALRHINLGGSEAELSLWGKNLTNRKDATSGLFTPLATSANYIAPRTYGVELGIEF